ncbi:phosphoenolpyruvate synthase [Streptomyces sp. MS06]|uniref:phosphoenolpyruvate synthase n=1 Tax=Streptomyces sp. MS06 TaxID=3385974 RepID=UPI0039A1A782
MSLATGSDPRFLHVLTPASDISVVAELAGGKGAGLHALTASGFRVPPWAVLGLDVFAEFCRTGGLAARLEDLSAGPRDRVPRQVSDEIARLFAEAPLDERVASAIALAYRQAGGGTVAVRSSGPEEDGPHHSFAGQFDSFLNVSGLDEVTEHVRRCWASAFSERSLRYRARHGLPPAAAGVAVVVQRMVPAERSGVLFTADPVTGRTGRYAVGAVHGLGEGLVGGGVDADTVVLDAGTGEVVSAVVGDKRERLDAGPGPGCTVSPVSEEARTAPVLTPADLALLHRLGTRADRLHGTPRDIEWAMAGGDLWVLQCRPVTTPTGAHRIPPEPEGETRLWDNSNIIESFSGVVSPLTYTFAADTYAKVYEGYARALGVRGRRLREVREWTPYLLGCFHGRVYYNLHHWYRMVRLAPLYPLNRRVLEKSLGVAESISDETADALHPFTPRKGLPGRISALPRTLIFAGRFLAVRASVARFHREFSRNYAIFNNIDYDALPGDETYRRFRRLQRELIEKWGPMQIVDATILLSVGVLALLTRRWLPAAPEWFIWAAAAPGGEVESAEPVRALAELARTARADTGLLRLLERTPDTDARRALREAGHTGFLAAVDAYVADYGYRSPDELKLEVADLHENPEGMFALLRTALADDGAGGGPGRHGDADAYLDARLRGWRRLLYERVRGKARSALTERERLRFCRTRAFGAAKRMLRALGRDLARQGALDAWDDVFLLRLEEVIGAYEGTLGHTELRDLAALRRRGLAADGALRAPARFTTRGAPYWSGNLHRAGWTSAPAVPRGARELQGTPCCPGVAEGRATVADTPGDFRGGVLLAYRTDPGWVTALPAASALVVERGSPLTHLAVVARELGVPTVVQVDGATTEIRTGALLRVDGGAGTVTVLADPPDEAPAPQSDGRLPDAPFTDTRFPGTRLPGTRLPDARLPGTPSPSPSPSPSPDASRTETHQ